MKKLLGALEMGGTKMVCAIGYADGAVAERARFDTADPVTTLAACASWFAEREIAALGVGAFGPTVVDPASPRYGCMLKTPKPNWSDFDILGTLHEQLDVPMGYDTDVNVACLGEATFGCARGLQDVVYLTIGTGVGAGVLSSGSLIHGAMHPEAGHIPLVRDAADPLPAGESACPFHPNCFEGLVCGPSLWKRWGDPVAAGVAHDPAKVQLIGGYLGQALMTIILCYMPRKIIVGGGVGDHLPILPAARKTLEKLLNGYLVFPEMNDLDSYIVGNSLDGDQGILGCFEMARRVGGFGPRR